MRYRKKPVAVEAWQVCANIGGMPRWLSDRLGKDFSTNGGLLPFYIKTLEGVMSADEGDWIVRDIKGELYPVKPDIFAATYEPEQAGASEALPEPRRGDTHSDALEAARRIDELWNWTGPRACFHDEHGVPMIRLEQAALIARALLALAGEK